MLPTARAGNGAVHKCSIARPGNLYYPISSSSERWIDPEDYILVSDRRPANYGLFKSWARGAPNAVQAVLNLLKLLRRQTHV
jgi:hypothetical protein